MMRSRRRIRAVALLAAVAAIAVAAAAVAAVTVYRNDLGSRHQVRELKHSRGKHCERDFLKGAKALGITIKRAPETCAESPPVVGDGPRPDHILRATGKIQKGTAKAIRDRAFLMLAVRVDKDGRYELRVFPKTGKFQLLRRPGGAAGFPVNGTEGAINGIGERNRLLLQARGDRVKAKVNGKRVAAITDPHPNELAGSRLEVGAGSRAHTTRNTEAVINDVRVQVPNP